MSKKKLPFPQLVRAFWDPYIRLAQYLKPYKKQFVMGLAFGVLAGCTQGLIPLVIKTAGDAILPAGQNLLNPRQFLKSGTDSGPGIEHVFWIAMLIPGIMVMRGLFSYLNSYCFVWVSTRVLRDIRTELFSHLISQSLGFFNRSKSGQLISRVMNDTRVAQNALTSISGDLVSQPVAVFSGVAVLVYLDWKFSLTSLVLFPICIVPIVFFGKKVRQAGRVEENEAGQMSVILQETFAGIRVIKSFAREDYQGEQFKKSSDLQCRNSLRVRQSTDIVQPIIESVSALGVVLALIYVFYFHISFIKFVALCGGIFLLYNPVKALSKIPMLMQKCMVSATNIFGLLKLQADVQDKPGAVPLKHCAGRVRFDRMSFSYGADKAAVEDITLDIEPGKKYALVGASGAGKSTMLSLLLRFYDPQKGSILVDERDIRDYTQRSLREQIGLVTQETFLFHDTIYENIRYGRLDATKEQIIEASKLAYAHDFILAQPDGYETIVGDKGCLLSGGQQQRLAIARALLKNAPVLLLDEATSALDSESERMIQAALDRLSEGRTVIAIAHRLSTILKSDCIVVMDLGRVAATGTHRELLDSSVLYRNLYELQFHHREG